MEDLGALRLPQGRESQKKARLDEWKAFEVLRNLVETTNKEIADTPESEKSEATRRASPVVVRRLTE